MLKESEKRVAICYFAVTLAMFMVALRVVSVAFSPKMSEAVDGSATSSVTLSLQRGSFFDCNMKPITNNRVKYLSLITDLSAAPETLSHYFNNEETADIISRLKEEKLPIIYTDIDISGRGVISYPYYENGNSSANHLIGYLNDEGHGVSGLSAEFDELLYSGKLSEITFGIDGTGRLITGERITFVNDDSIEKSGIMLTLDQDIQEAVDRATENLERGAAVVCDAKTGEIKAMVSRPNYDVYNIENAVNDTERPLINRAMLTYNVGSAFKPIVAAAAIEKGFGKFLCLCNGYADIDGLKFRCHKTAGHGWLDMSGAIKFSCNAYFYRLATEVGANPIYTMALKAGFNNAVSFGRGISTEKAGIGRLQRLEISDRALANLAIGQGELMVSPVGMLNLYSAIATDGGYTPPSLIKGEVNNLELTDADIENERITLMNKSTAKAIKKSLKGVLDSNGTGYVARPKTVTAAGKTSTAETGIIENGESVVNTWFCGFFPYEEPRFVAVVLAENTSSGCGDVFAAIADEITALKKP